MRGKFGLLGLGLLLLAGCMGLREQRKVETESLRVEPGATRNYRPNFPEGPRPANNSMMPLATPNP